MATAGVPELLFADEFHQILNEADEDDEERPGDSHKEEPGEHTHTDMEKFDHNCIVNQSVAGAASSESGVNTSMVG